MQDPERMNTNVNRRYFFQRALSVVVAGAAAPAAIGLLARPTRVHAQTNLSPDAALQELVAGNERFVANQLTSIAHDLAVLKEHTVEKQEPFAAVLACADSRIPVELVFDQTIGHIFVTRVAGNLVTPEIIASLEYSVAVPGRQDSPRPRPYQLWRRKGRNEGRQRSGANQRPVSASAACRAGVGRQSRQSHSCECKGASGLVAYFLARNSRRHQGWQIEVRLRSL